MYTILNIIEKLCCPLYTVILFVIVSSLINMLIHNNYIHTGNTYFMYTILNIIEKLCCPLYTVILFVIVCYS